MRPGAIAAHAAMESHWTRQSATIDPVERGDMCHSSLAQRAATNETATAGMSVAAATTTVADKSCARAAAANKKSASLEYVERAGHGRPGQGLSQRGGRPTPI